MQHGRTWSLFNQVPVIFPSQFYQFFDSAISLIRTLEPKLITSHHPTRLQLATFTGSCSAFGWVVTSGEICSSRKSEVHSSHCAWPHVASASEGHGLSFVFLSPEYRRNVFFVYEKRLRVHSPPEKVFEYFSSVKLSEGTFMTSLDLMRAAVPVFQPIGSSVIRSGYLGGEHKDAAETTKGVLGPLSSRSIFFELFDTDGDGLISFPEYIFFITLLSLSESEVKSTFQKFDQDSSGKLCRDEFIAMMRAMRRSTSRGNGSGLRTGLKTTDPDAIGNGLVQYLFGDPANEHKLSFEQFESFLLRIKNEIDSLEFQHYDFTDCGSISIQDFGYSVVAGANVRRMQYFIDRATRIVSSDIRTSGERINKDQFMAFCRILKHEGAEFQTIIKKHVQGGGKLTKEYFERIAMECGAMLSPAQIDVVFFIFDVDGDGQLSPDELLDVTCRLE